VRNIEVIIAENIIMAMQRLQLDQSELAQKANVSRKTISSIVNLKQDAIRLSTRIDIAKALGMTIEDLERDHNTHHGYEATIEMLHKMLEAIPDDIRDHLENASESELSKLRAYLGILPKKHKKKAN
jgi:DNA-binding XRE family transcriptional regulator